MKSGLKVIFFPAAKEERFSKPFLMPFAMPFVYE